MAEFTPETKAGIYRDVKAVFVRHSCDLGLLSITVTRSAVAVRGKLDRAAGATSPLTPQLVDAMIYEAQTIKGVNRLDLEFENWRRAEGGKWKKVK